MPEDEVKDETDPVGEDTEKEEDDDELEEDAEFDADLVTAAESVGLNPDAFETEDELYKETEARIRKSEAELAATPAVEKEDELVLAAVEVSLKNKADLDESIVSNLEGLATTTKDNFDKLAKRINAPRTGDKELRQTVQQLTSAIRNLSAQNVQFRLERWVSKTPKLQTFLGEGDSGDLDQDGKFARRRRSLIRRADKIATGRKGDFVMENMFAKAFKKMVPKSSATGKKETRSTSTRMARASGSSGKDQVDTSQSEASLKAEAAAVVRKFQKSAS